MKLLPRIALPTPFGGIVHTAEIRTPPFRPPDGPSSRDVKMIGQALGRDVTGLIKKIPVAGDIIGECLDDMHAAEIKSLLSPQELSAYMEHNKYLPSVLAMFRTLAFKGHR